MTLGATPLLEGRFAVITGASRGIGRAIAESFCAQGANVIASARVNTDDFHAWAKQLRHGCTTYSAPNGLRARELDLLLWR